MYEQEMRKLELFSLLSSFSSFKNFYRRIADLQCCVSFYCIAKWVGYSCTYIPPFLDFLPIYVTTGLLCSSKGLPCSSNGKESACNAGDPGSIPGSGRSSEEGNGNPLQYSCLENPMDRRTWWVPVHRVVKSQTQLSNLLLLLCHHRALSRVPYAIVGSH